MSTGIAVLFGWIGITVESFFVVRIWLGNRRPADLRISALSLFLPYSRRAIVRWVAAEAWWLLAGHALMALGSIAVLFPETGYEATGESPVLADPFLGAAVGCLCLWGCVQFLGRPKWAIPEILRTECNPPAS